MSQWIDLPLAVDTDGDTPAFVSSLLINLMLVRNPPGSPQKFAIASTPALSATISTAGSGAMRGMIVHGGYLWWVRGTQLRTWDGTTVTLVGTVAGTDHVHMVGTAATEIFIVDGAGNEYVADTASVTAVAPPAGSFIDCTYQDGYTIAVRGGTDEFYVSDLDDPTTFGALQFSTADAIADTLMACYVHNRELHLFGKEHLEIWQNTGASPFPFERAVPGVIDIGLFATASVAHYGSLLFFVGSDQRVYKLQGYTPVPISTNFIEWQIKRFAPEQKNMRASVYADRGKIFYCLSINTAADGMFVYDVEEGVWHTRTHCDSQAPYVDVAEFRPASSSSDVYVAIGSFGATTPGIYRLSVDDATDVGGVTPTREIDMPPFELGGRRVFEHELEINMSTSSLDGTIEFSFEDADGAVGGEVHSTITLNSAAPRFPVRFHRCGSFRQRKHFFQFELDSPFVVQSVRARVSVGT